MNVIGALWVVLSAAEILATDSATGMSLYVIEHAQLRAVPQRSQASAVSIWERREHALTNTRSYTNPHADVTLWVTDTHPAGRTLRGYGFWDGGDTFRIRCAFPQPLRARWFDPVKGVYEPVAGEIANQAIRQSAPSRNGDWVLQLMKPR